MAFWVTSITRRRVPGDHKNFDLLQISYSISFLKLYILFRQWNAQERLAVSWQACGLPVSAEHLQVIHHDHPSNAKQRVTNTEPETNFESLQVPGSLNDFLPKHSLAMTESQSELQPLLR